MFIPNAKEISRGAIWSIANQFIGQFLVLAVFLVTARFLTKEQFGVMAVCLMTVEILRQILIDGIYTTILSKRAPSKDFYNAAFTLLCLGGIASTLLIIIFAEVISTILNEPQITVPLQLLAPFLIITSLSKAQEAWLSKNFKFKSLALRSIVAVMVGGTTGVVMAYNGYGVMSLVTQQILTASISTVWLWCSSDWKPKISLKLEELKSVSKTSAHLSGNNSLEVISGQSDIFFITLYLGAASTGVYNVAKRILTAIHLIISSGLNSVALPVLASVGKDNVDIKEAFLKCVSLTSFATAPAYAGLAIFSSDIISVLLGDRWLDAAPVISILSLMGFLSSINQYNTNIFLVFERPYFVTIFTAINSITNIFLLFIFAKYGLLIVAAMLALRVFLITPIAFGVALHLLKVEWIVLVKKLLPSLSSVAVMSLSLLLLKSTVVGVNPALSLIVCIPVGVLIYMCSAYLTDRETFQLLIRSTLGK